MEYYIGDEKKLLKDVEKKLKEYCEKYNDSNCFPNRLQLLIEPDKDLLSDASKAIKNIEQIIKFKPSMIALFTFHIKDIIEDKKIITLYFDKKSAWIVKYPI